MALDRLGDPYRAARLVAVFGDSKKVSIPSRWLPYFEQIDVEWADCGEFERMSYDAQGYRRMEVMRQEADLVVLCDADCVILRPFGPELLDPTVRDAIAGVIAHFHFPWENGIDAATDWRTTSRAILGRDVPLLHRYSLAEAGPANCPFYVNYGFVAGRPATIKRLHEIAVPMEERVGAMVRNRFAGQISLALATVELGLETVALPMRYNFPNDPIAERKYPDEVDRICMLHYLRTENFDRRAIFASREKFESFLNLILTGSNRKWRCNSGDGRRSATSRRRPTGTSRTFRSWTY